jgi:hypothetical protein
MTAPLRPAMPTSTALRPALGLLAGLGVTVLIVFLGVTMVTLAALRGVDAKSYVAPFWTYPTNLVVSFVGAVAGGFTTARITEGRSLFTALVLALILLMSALAPVLRGAAPAPSQPGWYALSLALLPPIGALLGAARARGRERAARVAEPG